MELKLRRETPESSDSSGLFKRRAGPFVGQITGQKMKPSKKYKKPANFKEISGFPGTP
ncbi:hypothetical protein [Oscillibacter valericigenes]|uniref:hypothetical protein n=1 Tax=Oscillibacter valericigenes TaxID=351091 RepID=UPI00195AEFA9|nr:hypothetical protein [Oscillibacter valericigenes]MBM6909831.1 hypothetical protein [Oscillibacter valericigenes]